MKKYLLLFLIVSAGFGKLFSQTTNADCISAIQLCSTPSFTFNATVNNGNVNELPGTNSISNPAINPNPPNAGCLQQGENNPQWLIITVGNAGILEFVFGAGTSPNPQAGFYDWAMWPYTAASCAGIQGNTLPPVRCNWNGSQAGGTGIASSTNIPTGGVSANYQPPLPVNACDQFIICISNYSGINTLVSFQSLGTASLSCNPSCNNYNLCAGNTATITAVNYANLTNPTYSMNPGGLVSSTGSFVITPLVSTNYTTYISGLNGQSTTQTITSVTSVVVNPQPAVAPTLTQTSCTSTVNAVNLHLTFNPPTPVPTYTITWSIIPNGVTSPTQTTFTGGIVADPYSATVVAAGGCSAVANFTINPIPAPPNFTLTPLAGIFSVTCSHPNVVIDATNSSLSYTWTNGTSAPVNDSEALFNASNLGTWTVTGQNPTSGCVSSHTFLVVQNTVTPTGVVTPSFQNITCITTATTVTLTASPNINTSHHIYAPNGGELSIPSYTALYYAGPGIYRDTIINDQNGCYTVKTFTIASSDNYPTLYVTSTNGFTIGCGSHSITPITIFGETTPPPGGGSVTYTILPPNPPTTYGYGPLGQYNLTIPGQWTAVIKSLANNCETKVPFSVIQYTAGPDIHANVPLSILNCDSTYTTLTAITSDTNVAFAWSYPGPTGALTVINPTITAHTTTNVTSPSAGIYTLNLLNNDNGCTSTLTVPIQQNLFPPKAIISAGLSFSVTCATQTVQLSNNSITGIPNSTGFHTNQNVVASLWQGPTPQAPIQLAANYIGSTPGVYTLTATDLNNGCTSQTTTTVADNRVYPVITPTVPFILDCGSITTTVGVITTPSTGLVYLWTPPTTSHISGTLLTVPKLPITEPGIYRVAITNTNNGCSALTSVTVEAGLLNSNLSADHVSGYAPLNVNFVNNSTSLNTASIVSIWSFGNGTQSTTASASITTSALYTQPGTYTVTLYANKGSCLDTAMKIISVDIPSKLEIPNVFTPNGDGVNDIFFLKVSNLDEINALIYDRWGHKVYELVSGTGNIAWDGKTEAGKDASAGTYFYIIKATGKDGQTYDTKGTITLYR